MRYIACPSPDWQTKASDRPKHVAESPRRREALLLAPGDRGGGRVTAKVCNVAGAAKARPAMKVARFRNLRLPLYSSLSDGSARGACSLIRTSLLSESARVNTKVRAIARVNLGFRNDLEGGKC